MKRRFLILLGALVCGFGLLAAIRIRQEGTTTQPSEQARDKREASSQAPGDAVATTRKSDRTREHHRKVPDEYPADSYWRQLSHYKSQVSEQRIPWDQLEVLLLNLSEKLRPDDFHEILIMIGVSDNYTIDDKLALLTRFAPKNDEGGAKVRGAITTRLAEVDMNQLRDLVYALNEPVWQRGMAMGYYVLYYSDLPRFMELVTSDIQSEHPLFSTEGLPPNHPILSNETYWIACRLDSIVTYMVERERATAAEVVAEIRNADFDHTLKHYLLQRIKVRFPDLDWEQEGN
jgi:hypothetical protein